MPRKKNKNFIAVDNDTLGEEILPFLHLQRPGLRVGLSGWHIEQERTHKGG